MGAGARRHIHSMDTGGKLGAHSAPNLYFFEMIVAKYVSKKGRGAEGKGRASPPKTNANKFKTNAHVKIGDL